MKDLPDLKQFFKKEFTETLTFDELKHMWRLKALIEKKYKQEKIKEDFMAFVKEMWPEFIEGRHHKIIAEKFNDIANGKIKRLIINMPPRHTKSEFASYLLPSWMVGRNQNSKSFRQRTLVN